MKKLLTMLVIALTWNASAATNSFANGFDYALEVKGMICSFCAYSVLKQLRSLDGVVDHSVSVDLQNGMVTLQSEKTLQTTTLGEVIQAAGFQLGTVTETSLEAVAPRQNAEGSVVMSLTLNADRLVEGQFDTVLEALGEIASERSGRITFAGADETEIATLRPVLMGRRPVVDVEYDQVTQPDNTVRIKLLVD